MRIGPRFAQIPGPKELTLLFGDRTKLELGTTTKEELEGATQRYQVLNHSTLDYKGHTYSIIVNSHPDDAIKFSLKSVAKLISLPERNLLASNEQELAPLGVLIVRTK